MKIKELLPNLYHITFKKQYTLAMTFIRIQEYYESKFPEIRGTFFTLEDYMDIYADWKGNFTYPIDWSGFNVPGETFVEWSQLFWQFPDMSQKEINLYNKILPIMKNKGKNFYLIATTNNSSSISHEVAHGLYYLNSDYRKAINKLLNPRSKFYKEFKKELLKTGYCNEVICDETQAYSATQHIGSLIKDGFITQHNHKNVTTINDIHDIFKKYSKGIIDV